MRKLLLLFIVTVAMVGISNAQQHCKTSGCTVGYYDSDGFYVFGSCTDQLAVDCQNDRYNCGSVGNVCSDSKRCENGSCTDFDVLPWDDGENMQRPPQLQAFRIKPIPFKRWR